MFASFLKRSTFLLLAKNFLSNPTQLFFNSLFLNRVFSPQNLCPTTLFYLNHAKLPSALCKLEKPIQVLNLHLSLVTPSQSPFLYLQLSFEALLNNEEVWKRYEVSCLIKMILLHLQLSLACFKYCRCFKGIGKGVKHKKIP